MPYTLLDDELNNGESQHVFALLAFDDDGNEGVVADLSIPGHTLPMMVTQDRLLVVLQTVGRRLNQETGKPCRIVRFDRAEVLETFKGRQ